MSDLLHFQVDPSSGVPAYRQLMDQVRYYVAAGTLLPGDKLPSIRALARRLGLNPTTITKAYSELQHAKVVVLVQGKGVFIAEQVDVMSRERVRSELERLAAALAASAHQLGASYEVAADVLRREMERLEGAAKSGES